MAKEGPAQNRRAMTIGAVALGAVVVFFLASKLFGGGGGGGAGPSGSSGVPAESGVTSSGSGAGADPLLAGAIGESFEVFTIRDPFRPLIAPASAGGDAAPDAGVGSDTSGASGATGGTGGTGATGATGPLPAAALVALLDVFVDAGVPKARVRVDGTIYTVREGDAFAINFFVVALTEQCGEFVHADVRFSLCEGQETIT